ncbi:MAG: RsbRD N-terminal domain-containing protein [Thermomicrobiales bacterium]|jgi:hypothetical protein
MEAIDVSGAPAVSPSETPLHDQTTTSSGIVALVKDDSNRVVANWVIHVANTPAFRAWPSLGLAELQDSVPELIEAILATIRVAGPGRTDDSIANTVDVATNHGRKRGQAGFPIGALLSEFKALRQELCASLRRVTGDDPAWHDAALELETRLNTTIDIALIEAAEGWVDGVQPRTADE